MENQQGRGPGAQGQGRDQDPDPADMAARLVAQRERENWLQGQIRRVERASLLFLASIAPGVAERHIANMEAEARAERQRAEEAAEAARRENEQAENAESSRENGAEDTPEQQGAGGQDGHGDNQEAQPDLIAV